MVEVPPQPEPPPVFDDEPITNNLSPIIRQRWTVADLLNTEFPEPRWAIPGIIPEGLSVFGGRPKVGKSWMMLQAAWSVGTGGRFFNQEVERGEVLYLALEDGPRRLQERIKAMGIGSEALITFVNRWPPLHQSGMNELLIELEREVYRLLVIDTLTRSMPGIDAKKDGGVIGKVFDDLQRLAMTRNTAIVLIDHTRKPSGYAADPVDDILHATEKTAIADCILALYKQQGKPGATLLGRGRDIEDVEFPMQFDPITRCWQAENLSPIEKYAETFNALEELGKAMVGDVANMIGKNKGNVYKELVALVDAEVVKRDTIGRNVFYEVIKND